MRLDLRAGRLAGKPNKAYPSGLPQPYFRCLFGGLGWGSRTACKQAVSKATKALVRFQGAHKFHTRESARTRDNQSTQQSRDLPSGLTRSRPRIGAYAGILQCSASRVKQESMRTPSGCPTEGGGPRQQAPGIAVRWQHVRQLRQADGNSLRRGHIALCVLTLIELAAIAGYANLRMLTRPFDPEDTSRHRLTIRFPSSQTFASPFSIRGTDVRDHSG